MRADDLSGPREGPYDIFSGRHLNFEHSIHWNIEHFVGHMKINYWFPWAFGQSSSYHFIWATFLNIAEIFEDA
jgi:hypothetical protein